jgi:hypothetical protein
MNSSSQSSQLNPIVSSNTTIFPLQTYQFFSTFSKKHFPRLQHLLSQHFQDIDLSFFKQKYLSNPTDQARFHSISSSFASLPFATLPLNKDLQIDDKTYKIAFNMRFGLTPFPSIPSSTQLFCYNCHRSFTSQPYHILHCLDETKKSRFDSHEALVSQLFSISQRCHLNPSPLQVQVKSLTSLSISLIRESC